MATDPVNPVAPETAPVGAATDARKPDAQRLQIQHLAEEFEAMLMTQMLRGMRQSMLAEEEHSGGFGSETMTDTVDIELGRALSRVGGFGLSAVLMKAIERQTANDGSNPTKGTSEAVPVPAPAELPAPTSLIPMPSDQISEPLAPSWAPPPLVGGAIRADNPGPISSEYGWRRDPFTGAAQFHKGVDVALAYGTEVHAAADGRVVFSGVNRGYGNLVIVEHGDGRQTRYAHLSARSVQAGDSVQTGQVIGKVGSSGHATGPHLHFEVVDNGRAVNPFGVIKGSASAAD